MRCGWFKYIFFVPVLLLASCADNAITDVNMAVKGHNWSYINKIKVPVNVEDNTIAYNIYLNLRHTADYKYSNIFVRIHESGPGMKHSTTRQEFTLAEPDGEWLGKGSGNLYSYQLLYKEGYHFPAKGTYIFEVEQNMRDNPLKEVSDVGIRVERAGAN